MAEKAITTVIEKLFPLLEEELQSLSGVSTEVGYSRGELERMQAFLRAADARDEIEERVQICVRQVRDVVYDTEDVLEEFILQLAQDHGDGCLGLVCKMVGWVANLQARLQIASNIKDIKRRVQDISEGSQRYLFNSLEQGLTRSITSKSIWHDRRGDALLMDEAELVGFEKPIETLVGLLLDGESQCGVISVAGMGGLGKTALVKKVYDDQRVEEHFQCHAWITVSQSFKIEKLLKDLLQKLFNERKQPIPHDLDTTSNVELKEMIKKILQKKRYVIVFDDIWSMGSWEAFKYALPNSNCCSRVILTTRFIDIASSCKASFSFGHVYTLEPLDSEKSWTLFCKKVFGGNTCPRHLKQISESILRRCQGLPLAIVAIGGLLATKDNTRTDDWDIVNRSLGIELNKSDEFKSMMKILSLSYNHLPHYLKPCFLYLSLFPEKYMFKSRRLIRLWIAEGFVEEQAGWTLEEVAESYLNDLINRSLIQIAETAIDGSIRRCRVHDLIRDIILLKSKDQNFGTIIDERKTSHPERIRRLSLHKTLDNKPLTKCLFGLRSLILTKVHTLSSIKSIGDLRLLKVLDLRNAPLEIFPNEITNLFHLRYLSLRRTKIRMLPDSIERLQNLEVLDLKHAHVHEMPMGIFKLQKLRHLLVYSYDQMPYVSFQSILGFQVGTEIGRLATLQKLCFIEPNNHLNQGGLILKEIGRLSQLRTLGIQKLRREDGKDLCYSIENMTNLRSLNLCSIEENEALDLQSLSSPPPFLRTLCTWGRLEMLPHWIPLLPNLVRISLLRSHLRADPLEVLGALPNLVHLELAGAYEGDSLCFKTDRFKKLKRLALAKFNRLRWIRVEKGTMPLLQELCIALCELLEKVPFGIEHLVNLKELEFYGMPDEFITGLHRDKGDDQSKISHIPSVDFFFRKGGRWHKTSWRRS